MCAEWWWPETFDYNPTLSIRYHSNMYWCWNKPRTEWNCQKVLLFMKGKIALGRKSSSWYNIYYDKYILLHMKINYEFFDWLFPCGVHNSIKITLVKSQELSPCENPSSYASLLSFQLFLSSSPTCSSARGKIMK